MLEFGFCIFNSLPYRVRGIDIVHGGFSGRIRLYLE